MRLHYSIQLSLALVSAALVTMPGLCQVPLPGSQAVSGPATAPVPGITQSRAAAVHPGEAAGYRELPLSYSDAESRLKELRALLLVVRAQDIKDAIYQECDWLADMADAHYRMSQAFARVPSTKPQADAERLAAHRFSQLKHKAQLLKADWLIRQQRFAEALGPLVDIVIAEPSEPVGETAYQRLKEIGFAEDPPAKIEAKPITRAQIGAPAADSISKDRVARLGSKPKICSVPLKARSPKTTRVKGVLPDSGSHVKRRSKMRARLSAAMAYRSRNWLAGSPVGDGSSRKLK